MDAFPHSSSFQNVKISSIFSPSQPYRRDKDNISRSISRLGISYQAPSIRIQESNMKLTTLPLLLFLSIVGTLLSLAPSLPTTLSNQTSSLPVLENFSFKEMSKSANFNITQVVGCAVVGFCLLLGFAAFLICQIVMRHW